MDNDVNSSPVSNWRTTVLFFCTKAQRWNVPCFFWFLFFPGVSFPVTHSQTGITAIIMDVQGRPSESCSAARSGLLRHMLPIIRTILMRPITLSANGRYPVDAHHLHRKSAWKQYPTLLVLLFWPEGILSVCPEMQRQLATSHSIPRRNPMMTPTKSKLCNPGELKKPRQSRYFLFLLPLALAACSSMPSGPNVMVLPGKGVSFEQFRADDLLCRQYAAPRPAPILMTPPSTAVSKARR